MIPHDKDLFTAVPTTCYISSSQQNITGCDKTQEKKTHSFKREACARTRHRYKINFKIIRELNFTVINMLMALMGKVGNMQEQIDNVKRKTRTKNQEKIHLLIFEY